ncbi:MAG: SRPBCC family protein, partial [Calditrichaeota bacterium]
MKQSPQWAVEVHIAAPVAKVWEAIEDLSLIPRYHPVVREVEYVS